MVNNTTHPIYYLPKFDGVNRIIECEKPLYELDDIKNIVKNPEKIFLVTDKCIKDVANLAWDTSDVAELINKLTPDNYEQSEWCQTNGNSNRPCDSYVCVVQEYNDVLNKMMRVEYYLKFSTNTSGQMLLMVSCHV